MGPNQCFFFFSSDGGERKVYSDKNGRQQCWDLGVDLNTGEADIKEDSQFLAHLTE